MGILVAHPGRQHSHQLALALHGAGMLFGYWTGVPVHRTWWMRAAELAGKHFRHDAVDIPRELVRQWPIATLARELGRVARFEDAPIALAHAGDAAFDSWTARRLRALAEPPRVVVCYENSALRTFSAARACGAVTVLDAASVHHSEQARQVTQRVSRRTALRIARRKDLELALADRVIVTSRYARDTYVRAGIGVERIDIAPLGVDLGRFTPTDAPLKDGRLRILFAGTPSAVKGIDLLLQAVASLRSAGVPLELTVAGGSTAGYVARDVDGVRHVGRLHQRDLARLLHESDCLVLPSRFDSFGMVVLEALAAGVPAIVTDHVGACDVIQEGINGWIVRAADAMALERRLRWCALNRAQLAAMRAATRASAVRYDWAAYHDRIRALFTGFLS